ncbi:MAG: hypothetical protein ACYTBR_15060, partial [Planctomycetota bacterium]
MTQAQVVAQLVHDRVADEVVVADRPLPHRDHEVVARQLGEAGRILVGPGDAVPVGHQAVVEVPVPVGGEIGILDGEVLAGVEGVGRDVDRVVAAGVRDGIAAGVGSLAVVEVQPDPGHAVGIFQAGIGERRHEAADLVDVGLVPVGGLNRGVDPVGLQEEVLAARVQAQRGKVQAAGGPVDLVAVRDAVVVRVEVERVGAGKAGVRRFTVVAFEDVGNPVSVGVGAVRRETREDSARRGAVGRRLDRAGPVGRVAAGTGGRAGPPVRQNRQEVGDPDPAAVDVAGRSHVAPLGKQGEKITDVHFAVGGKVAVPRAGRARAAPGRQQETRRRAQADLLDVAFQHDLHRPDA